MAHAKHHDFHIVDPSPWPFTASMGAFALTTGGVLYMHSYQDDLITFYSGAILILFTMGVWWRDVIREATFEGKHTEIVRNGLRMGMVLFIVSEVFFFVAFFWAFFHSSLVPVVDIGVVWPPKGIATFNAMDIPLLNTLILLSSGATCTAAHEVVGKKQGLTSLMIFFTIVLGLIFTFIQGIEYVEAPFQMNDSVYGSCFFMATGFHGLHVLIGTLFLIVCLFRSMKGHFTVRSHVGFESAAWYWHFVDVVWLFLFVAIYAWGGYPVTLPTEWMVAFGNKF